LTCLTNLIDYRADLTGQVWPASALLQTIRGIQIQLHGPLPCRHLNVGAGRFGSWI